MTNTHFVERVRCPGCGAPRARTLRRCSFTEPRLWSFIESYYGGRVDRAWLQDGIYQVDECDDCGLVFQRFVGTDALLEELYDRWLNSTYHPDRDPAVQEALAHPARSRDGHELFAVAHARRRPVSELRVLDYGMGWGLWARVAKQLGARVYGFDLSRTRRDFARSHGIEVVDRSELAGLELDFVNTEQVFEHVTMPYEDARDLASALAPGAILKIAVPQAPGIEARVARFDWNAGRGSRWSLNAVHPLEHVNCWSARSIEKLGARVGLRPRRVPLRGYAAFMARRDALDVRSPRQIAKAVLRPAYHALSRTNLYRWLEKALPD